jgi:CheY-like chemotaxis protein
VRVLVVDDNPDALRVVENFLKTVDHVVFSYTDAREALLWLKDVRPEVIVADLDMPGMNGYEFIRRLRAYSSCASVPVVCITGTDAKDEEIYAAGFSHILRKPVTLADMLEALEVAVKNNSAATAITPPEGKVTHARDNPDEGDVSSAASQGEQR